MRAIEVLRQKLPKFHGGAGEEKDWKSGWELLEFFAANIGPGMATLETGCGYSTIVLGATGASHTTITPEPLEIDRVKGFAADNGIEIPDQKFAVGPSSDVLPTLEKTPLDLVYIDGAHGFPHPCVDWLHTEGRVKVGGLMLVDDVRIPACRVLHDFLMGETDVWRFEKFFADTSVFRKIAESPNNALWMPQRMNRGYPDFSFLPASHRALAATERVAGPVLLKLGLRKVVRRLLGRDAKGG
jgi:hypothetical protein